jgi:acetyl-CoA synthetase
MVAESTGPQHRLRDGGPVRGGSTRGRNRGARRHDQVTALSYRQLRDLTGRFADGLRRLGVGRTERVFTLLGRVPKLYVAALGTLEAGCVLVISSVLSAGHRVWRPGAAA